jgi:hypothetical protein
LSVNSNEEENKFYKAYVCTSKAVKYIRELIMYLMTCKHLDNGA